MAFDEWLVNTGAITKSEHELIGKAVDLYNTSETPHPDWAPEFPPPDEAVVKSLLRPKGFVFVDA